MSLSAEGRKKTWERRMDLCKSKHRPKLKDWSRDRFAYERNAEFLNLRCVERGALSVGRIDARVSDIQDFRRLFENPNIPCIIENIPVVEDWKAKSNWQLENLRKKFKDRLFKVGEDDDGYKVKAKLKYFLEYMKYNMDDSPLYIFDGNFDGDKISKSLLNDYNVPSYFTDDLFSVVGEDRRPPYRWFLLGPERSGSTVHVDPLGTSAWNTLISGRKRWVLFPPSTSRNIAKGLNVIQKGEDDEAINYFVDMLPRIRAKHGHHVEIYELIQNPGETIFVPGGWWHGVLNLEDTVAITQNFCSYVNFDRVWRATRKGRKKMSQKWLRKLHEDHPVLGLRAEELNRIDAYEWPPRKSKRKKTSTVSESDGDAASVKKLRKID